MKNVGALLSILMVLTACVDSPGVNVITPMYTDWPKPTSTPLAYWDLHPLVAEPVGGWKTHRMEGLRLAFQYPSIYDEVDCGRVFVEEKVVGESAYTLVGLGSSIRIRVYLSWDTALDEYISEGITRPELKLLTEVETFYLDGVFARRHILQIPESSALEYIKIASAIYERKLYVFQFNDMVELSSCDAPPLSEEAVYEHLLSTLEFIQ